MINYADEDEVFIGRDFDAQAETTVKMLQRLSTTK